LNERETILFEGTAARQRTGIVSIVGTPANWALSAWPAARDESDAVEMEAVSAQKAMDANAAIQHTIVLSNPFMINRDFLFIRIFT
jgi:hypothetical protein